MKNVLFLLLCLLIAGCTNGALYRADPNYDEKGWAGCVTKAVIKKILVKVSNKLIGYGIGLAVEMVACVWDCMDFKF